MRRLFLVTEILALGLVTGVSAESLYLTTSQPLENVGYESNGSYTFIAPYFTHVKTKVSVSIVKAATTANSTARAVSPAVLHAVWAKPAGGHGLITYSVSCDLTSVIHAPGDSISVSQMPTPFGGHQDVLSVTSDTVVVGPVDTQPNPTTATGGTITDVSCPSPGGDTFSVTLGVTPVPTSRAYLYLRSNAFFNDSVNVSVGSDGMLSSSDTSSAQQITAILTELAQTAAPVLSHEFKTIVSPPSPRQKCYNAVASFVKSAPYYDAKLYNKIQHFVDWQIPISDPLSIEQVVLHLTLRTLVPSRGQVSVDQWNGQYWQHWHYGLVAFFPVTASAEIYCTIGDPDDPNHYVLVSSPTIVNLYSESHFLDPQRDFLTNPQDTFTFNSGFITGHKYLEQSPAKTIVDTLTAPLRAIIPSVSTQQTTQVQTGGGKPAQTTTTTQTTTGPPKAQ